MYAVISLLELNATKKEKSKNRFLMANTLSLKTAMNKLTQAMNKLNIVTFFKEELLSTNEDWLIGEQEAQIFCDPVLWLSLEWGATKVWEPGFNNQLVLLSQATGYVSSGNLSAFDVITSKACKITGSNRKIAYGNSIILSQKLCLQNADNRCMITITHFQWIRWQLILRNVRSCK